MQYLVMETVHHYYSSWQQHPSANLNPTWVFEKLEKVDFPQKSSNAVLIILTSLG